MHHDVSFGENLRGYWRSGKENAAHLEYHQYHTGYGSYSTELQIKPSVKTCDC